MCRSYYIKGLTLLELLAVVVIVAILGVFAYPAYQNHALNARSTDAKVKLLEIMQQQREFFTDNNTYTTDLIADLGYTDAGGGAVATENGLFNITAGQCGTDSVTRCVELSAAPVNTQAGDVTYTYNSRNEKTPSTHW